MPSKSPTSLFRRRLAARLWDLGHAGLGLGSSASEHPLMAGAWSGEEGLLGLPPNFGPVSFLLLFPSRKMASAATEEEKGSPVVVGLLVVGNIIILVRPQFWGAWGGDNPKPEVGMRTQVYLL